MSIRIIHAADFHLDSPFEALGSLASERRAEQRLLLTKIAHIAEEKKADLILLAGDLLDSAFCYRETLDAIRDAFGGAPCPVVIAPGNHDCLSPSSPYLKERFPENAHIFKSASITPLRFSELGLTIYGAGYISNECPPLLRGFRAQESDDITIGLLHSQPLVPNTRYCPVSQEDISLSGLDYLALGHVHSFSGLQRSGSTFWAYPGCPEGRGFDEAGVKGIICADVDKGSCCAEFIPTSETKYEILNIDVSSPDESGFTLYDTILSALPDNTSRDIYRIVLTGTTPKAPDITSLQGLLQNRFRALQLKDSTTMSTDIWEGTGSSSLRGIFLRRMREKYDSALSDDERSRVIAATRWGLAAIDGREAVTRV